MKRPIAVVLAALQFVLPAFASAGPVELRTRLSAPEPISSPTVPIAPVPLLQSGLAVSQPAAAPPATPPAAASPLAAARALAAEAAAAPPASAESARSQGEVIFSGAAPASGATSENAPLPELPELPAEPPVFAMRHFGRVKRLLAPVLNFAYRHTPSGVEHLPPGPALIVANHVNHILDALQISLSADRPIRYLLYDRYYYYDYYLAPRVWDFIGIKGVVQLICNALGMIPLGSTHYGARQEDVDRSLGRVRAALKNGETVAIFPEGQLTGDGNLGTFRRGFERIMAGLAIPVVPAHLDNLWRTFFSNGRERSLAARSAVSLRMLRSEGKREVGTRFGTPLKTANAKAARDAIQELSAEALELRLRREAATLPRNLLRTGKRLWSKPLILDSTGRSLTYGRFLTEMSLLSDDLYAKLSPAKRVGVLLPRSADITDSRLANAALLAAGKVPVNLDDSLSAEGIEHALGISEIDTVVTARQVIADLKRKGVALPRRPYVFIDDLRAATPQWKWDLRYANLRRLPARQAEALFMQHASHSLDDEAAVVFTGGSMARPKGIVLSHLNIQSTIEMLAQALPFGPSTSMLGTLPFVHSVGLTMSLWLPMLRGLSTIDQLADKFKPTILLAAPSASAVADFKAKLEAQPLAGYGSAELSVAALSVPGHKGSKEGSVGRVLPGMAAKIVDPETWQDLPFGRQGLLLVKGRNVMQGYLNEPESTSAALRDGWYVTGEQAAIDPDGHIFFKDPKRSPPIVINFAGAPSK